MIGQAVGRLPPARGFVTLRGGSTAVAAARGFVTLRGATRGGSNGPGNAGVKVQEVRCET